MRGAHRIHRAGRGQLPGPDHRREDDDREPQRRDDDGPDRDRVVAEQAHDGGDQRTHAELDGAQQCGGGAGRLAVAGQRDGRRVRQREAAREEDRPQRDTTPGSPPVPVAASPTSTAPPAAPATVAATSRCCGSQRRSTSGLSCVAAISQNAPAPKRNPNCCWSRPNSPW